MVSLKLRTQKLPLEIRFLQSDTNSEEKCEEAESPEADTSKDAPSSTLAVNLGLLASSFSSPLSPRFTFYKKKKTNEDKRERGRGRGERKRSKRN